MSKLEARARRGPFAGVSLRSMVPASAAVVATTVAAVLVFPQMDDGYLLQLLKEEGPRAIAAAHPDRPLVGWIWQAAATVLGARFWAFGFAATAALWWLVGAIAAALWVTLFPEWRRYAAVPALLAVSPIIARVQLPTVTMAGIGVLSTVLVSLGALLLLKAAPNGWLDVVMGLALAGVGTLLSEYGFAAAIAWAVILWTMTPANGAGRRARVPFWLVSLGGYAALAAMGLGRRRSVSPVRLLRDAEVWKGLPFNLVNRFSDIVAGEVASRAARITIDRQSMTSLGAFSFGILLAVLAVVSMPRVAEGVESTGLSPGRRIAVLAVALLAGLVPIALMRVPAPGPYPSRFQLPIVPFGCCLTVALLLNVLRADRRIVVLAFVAFVAGVALVSEAADARRRKETLLRVGQAARKLVEPGTTYAFIMRDLDFCPSGSAACTGTITESWPVDVSRRVWFIAGQRSPDDCRRMYQDPVDARGVSRSAQVERAFSVGIQNGQPVFTEGCGGEP